MSDFNATPVGSVVQTCGPQDPCAASWSNIKTATDRVDGMQDVRERNRVISASYARLYQQSPDLQWAGAAAFASKQVGCGMDDAARYGPLGSKPRQVLGDGNLAVYDELYAPLKFYSDNKGTMSNDQIIECMDHKPSKPPVDDSTKRGLQQIMDGKPKEGSQTMLFHEQHDTLQTSVYDASWIFRQGLSLNRATSAIGLPLAPTSYVISAECSSNDSSLKVELGNTALQDFDSRWPFAQNCANRFSELASSPSSSAAVDQALSQIANAAHVP